MSHWIALALAIISEVIGTSFLKSADGFTRLAPSLIVIVAAWLGLSRLSRATCSARRPMSNGTSLMTARSTCAR